MMWAINNCLRSISLNNKRQVNSKYPKVKIGGLFRNPFWILPSEQIAHWNSYWSSATQKLVCPPKPFNLDFRLHFKTFLILSKTTINIIIVYLNRWFFLSPWHLVVDSTTHLNFLTTKEVVSWFSGHLKRLWGEPIKSGGNWLSDFHFLLKS